MKDFSIIVPVREGESIDKYNSVFFTNVKPLVENGCTIVLVGEKSCLEKLSVVAKEYSDIKKSKLITVDSNGGYYAMLNDAVYHCPTKYFTVVHIEDTLAPFWFDVVKQHVAYYGLKYSTYLPVTENVDNGDKFVCFSNEIALSTSFSDNLGEITLESLDTYFNYTLTGGVFRTEDFISCGRLKPSMGCGTLYEFLLRYVYNGFNIYVVPRVGYTRNLGVGGSFKDDVAYPLGGSEYDKMIEKCRSEYLFKNDRTEG